MSKALCGHMHRTAAEAAGLSELTSQPAWPPDETVDAEVMALPHPLSLPLITAPCLFCKHVPVTF